MIHQNYYSVDKTNNATTMDREKGTNKFRKKEVKDFKRLIIKVSIYSNLL